MLTNYRLQLSGQDSDCDVMRHVLMCRPSDLTLKSLQSCTISTDICCAAP